MHVHMCMWLRTVRRVWTDLGEEGMSAEVFGYSEEWYCMITKCGGCDLLVSWWIPEGDR